MRELEFYITPMGYSKEPLDEDYCIHIHCYVKYESLTKLIFLFSPKLVKEYELPEEEEVFLDEPISDEDVMAIENEISCDQIAQMYGLDMNTDRDIIFEYGFASYILWRQYLPIQDFEFPSKISKKIIDEYIVKLRTFQSPNKLFLKIKDGFLGYIYLFKWYIIKPEISISEPDLITKNHSQIRNQLIAEVSNILQTRYLQIMEESKKHLVASLEPLIKDICYTELRSLQARITNLEAQVSELKNKSKNN